MGRAPVSGPSGRNSGHRHASGASRGLRVVEAANGYLYLSGTVRAGGGRVRVRKSTGLHCGDRGAEARVEEIRRNLEKEIQDQLIHGTRPPRRFAAAAADYVTAVRPGKTDTDNLRELITAFGEMSLDAIDGEMVDAFYRRRFPAAAPATLRRHQATLVAVFRHARTPLPAFTRPKLRRRRGGGLTKRFYPGEAELLIDCAPPHVRPLLATLYTTGRRVGETIGLPREAFVLAPGRGRVIFPETKNGNAYSVPLPDYTVEILLAWLEDRRDRHAAMFLTDKRRPYAPARAHGGQIKAAFDAARERAATELERLGRPERARVIRQATPHWFRHNFANTLRAHGADARNIAEAGGWLSTRLVSETYLSDTPEAMERLIRGLPFGKKLAGVGRSRDQSE